jgi:hypothetical protein
MEGMPSQSAISGEAGDLTDRQTDNILRAVEVRNITKEGKTNLWGRLESSFSSNRFSMVFGQLTPHGGLLRLG